MNFGYHILTETIGLAFAFGACYLVYQILVRLDNNIQKNRGKHNLYTISRRTHGMLEGEFTSIKIKNKSELKRVLKMIGI